MTRNNKRLSIEFVRDKFESEGCELISTEYVNARTLLDYRCSCGAVSKIRYDNFRNGNRCNNCRYVKISEKRKHSIEFIKAEFKRGGCRLLSTEYVNSHTPLEYICECGNISKMRYSNFKQGQRCAECRIPKISGKNSPHYKPELTDEQRALRRDSAAMRSWRKDVFERDDYTCLKCEKRGNGQLNAHHIKSYDIHEKLRHDINNGVTLCKRCHREFHNAFGFGKNNGKQFVQWLLEDENYKGYTKLS